MKPTPRQYIELTQLGPYPSTPLVAYECGMCGDVVPSAPAESAACRCGNIIVDATSSCVTLGELAAVKAFRTQR
ncbi:MAG: hypothetical protein HYX44_09935 [Aquabacterium sp.]|nr:hypothetical protein [Aquabacterium sp.]